MRCPDCEQKLIRNKYDDLVCPIHGIIYYHKEENKEEKTDYIG
jgi:uncharacterized Zn finger protein (UPF0148 family)